MDIPWISRDKVHVEVSYKVTNLSATTTGAFTLIVDGASEYTKYDTQIVAAALMQAPNDPPVFLPLIATVPQTLAPGPELQRHRARGRLRRGRAGPGRARALERCRPGHPTFAGVLINRSEVEPASAWSMVPDTRRSGTITHAHPSKLVVPAMSRSTCG